MIYVATGSDSELLKEEYITDMTSYTRISTKHPMV